MRIAIAQIDCRPGDVGYNVEHMVGFVHQAKAAGCALVVFPEMSDTGYWPEKFAACAGQWPGAAQDRLSGIAAELSIAIAAGLSEREGESVYNSLAFFDADGRLVGKYRKTHLYSPPPASERDFCTAGCEGVRVNYRGFDWTLSVCYDLRFPELYRLPVCAGSQVLINVAAWPVKRPAHWDVLTRARAIENQAFFIAANRAGSDGPFKFLGHSRIITPMGDLLAEAGAAEQLITADIDPALVNKFRDTVPALADRVFK